MTGFPNLVRELHEREVRFLLIGVWGANYYAHTPSALFATQDHDLFMPLDADNLVRAWQACEALGLELLSGRDPLDSPRDLWLAERVAAQRALTRARAPTELEVDLTFVMGDFEFDDVWRARRTFLDHGVRVPVARLSHIVASKAAAGRPKDRLFLETHQESLRELLREDTTRDDPSR